MKRGGALFVAAVVFSGCMSSTIINSRPDNAQVNVDGMNIGPTPAQWSDTVWAGTKNRVKITLPGYYENNTTIAADQWQVGRVVISAICFLPGLLWSTEYRPSYDFVLQPDPSSGMPAQQYQQNQYQQNQYPPQGPAYPPPPTNNYPPPPTNNYPPPPGSGPLQSPTQGAPPPPPPPPPALKVAPGYDPDRLHH